MNSFPKSIESALGKQQERLYLLHLEKNIIQFINAVAKGKDQAQYTIKAHFLRNSYYRLLSHQLCQYYNLQHWNNTSSEILVTPIDDFDYQVFVELVESQDFVKVSDMAANLQESEPEPAAPKPKLIIKKSKDRKGEPNESEGLEPTESEAAKIESERASKEALYLKVREEIFDQEEEEEDEDEEHKSHRYHNYNYNQNQNNNNGYIPYSYPGTPPLPGPMSMPINYNGSPQQHFTPPGSAFYPQNMSPVSAPPMFQPNYYPMAPMMPPQGYYGYGYGSPQAAPYDKETERRLLNNPYIIIPDDAKSKIKGKTKRNYNQHYKQNHGHNGYYNPGYGYYSQPNLHQGPFPVGATQYYPQPQAPNQNQEEVDEPNPEEDQESEK